MEQERPDWQPPPPPASEKNTDVNAPQMSELSSILNIFLEPGKTFESLRARPRFILGGILIIILASLFQFLLINKLGFEHIVKERINNSPGMENVTGEQREKIIEQQSSPIAQAIGYAAVPVVSVIVFAIGGLLYWLGANAMGGSSTFLRGLSTWIYSSIPPAVLGTFANIVVLFLKAPEDIDIVSSNRGLIHANPSMFLDGREAPVLATVLSTLDLFSIWGWILAAIGLRVVSKISSGAAWSIVIGLTLIGLAVRVVFAALFKAPM